MKKFLVIGGGQQGQVVASQLAKKGHRVTLADFRRDLKPMNPKVSVEYFDARDVLKGYRSVLGQWFASFDVVVSCLPSQFGGPCVELAAEHGANYVDLSYTTDNLFLLGPMATHTGCTIITDVGLAPGLPNMISGHFLEMNAGYKGEKCPEINIYVGGVSKDPSLPLGYVETWSLEDLYEEYVRPGRYVKDGEEVIVSPTDLSALKTVQFENQEFEAFTSDGLRTLLAFKKVIPNMREWTLRYPGHMKQIETMLYGVGNTSNGTTPIPKERFVEKFRHQLESGQDRVILAVDCMDKRYGLVVDGTPEITAMSKTTAHTTAVVAEFLSDRLLTTHDRQSIDTGVQSMELIGRKNDFFKDILLGLEHVGVNIVSEKLNKS